MRSKQVMEIDKLNNNNNNSKLKEEPHLSGAYIRSLVKQLTSSRTKDSTMNSTNGSLDDDANFSTQNMTKITENLSDQNQQPQLPLQPQQHKKQVRRRLHTSRPYQERLLNMAEARREIVAALKFHRASMKQADEKQQQPSSRPVQLTPAETNFEQEGKTKSRRNHRIYPSNTANFTNYIDNFSSNSFSHHAPIQPSPSYPYYWPSATSPILPNFPEYFNNFPLPNQTLGLNLNFQDFNDIDTSLYHSSNNPSSVYSSSSPPSFSSPSPSSFSIATEQDLPKSSQEVLTDAYGGSGLHLVMDDEEMAEMRSMGEQHQMEWNDRMNLVTSARWFKFMKSMEESGPAEMKVTEDDENGFYQPFDQVMEFPSWLNGNDNEGCLQQHFDDYCSQDYYHDPSLPCGVNTTAWTLEKLKAWMENG